ncbi:MAG: Ig-like domain-containing protein [Bryobacteraceae bacterium]
MAGFLLNPERLMAGEPFYCNPNEGAAAIIVNGGSGVFTVSNDCFGGVAPNATKLRWDTYTPSPLNYTGTDTFTLAVTTSHNGSAGGPGDFAGGAGSVVVTLNVIPASTTLMAISGSSILVPIPPGSISGCPATRVNGGMGPPAGTIYGCITAVAAGTVPPSHGTLTVSGSTIRYSPAFGYVGPDTFTYQAEGIDGDGTTALSSGDVTVSVTVYPQSTPTLSEWS